jgi:gliding motility-associated-like protein
MQKNILFLPYPSLSKKAPSILSLFLLLIGFNQAHLLAQSQQNTLEGFNEATVLQEFRTREGSELKYPTAYQHFLDFKKQEFIGKKNTGIPKTLTIGNPPTVASGECGNIDFETGDFTEWSGKTGGNPGCCGTNGLVSNGVNAATNDMSAQHTIVTGAGIDPCGGFPVVPPPMPGQVPGTYACRLGNSAVGAQAEQIEIVFTPSLANNIFTYQYAAVLENAGHDEADQPFFRVEMLDGNDVPIPCTTVKYIAEFGNSADDFLPSPDCGGVSYLPWSTVSVDLIGYVGVPVTIRFTTGDCTAGGHYGYGYLNAECTQLAVVQIDSLCTGGSVSLKAPKEADNTYNWVGPGGPYVGDSISVSQAGDYTVTMESATGCIKVITYTVIEYPTAFVNVIPDQTICSNDSATLTATVSGAATSGTWTGGTGTYTPSNTSVNCTYTPSPAEITAGTVTLVFTTNNPTGPCPAATDTVTITINPQATVSAGVDQTICFGNTVTLAATVGGASVTGFWTGGTGTYAPDNLTTTAVYTPTTPEATNGTVSLIFTTDDPVGPCPSVNDTMVITVNQLPTANAGSSEYVCVGESLNLSGSIGGSATSATWSGGTGTFVPNNTTLNAVYTPSQAEYDADSVLLTLTTNDPTGPCTFSSSSVKFHFYKNPVVSFLADDPDGCPTHCVNFSDATTVGGGGTIVSWSWDFGDGGVGSVLTNPSNCFDTPGLYDIKLSVESDQGCTSFLTIPEMIEVYNIPIADFIPTPSSATVIDPSVTLVNNSSPDVNYWGWYFGDGDSLLSGPPSPTHEYPNEVSSSYTATLIVENANGCTATTAKPIYIGPEFSFFIPNAFTPNGDGSNDYFFGNGIGIEQYDLWILDRWGNMVFHGNDLDDKWDGKSNGGSDASQIDVFVWKVQLVDVFKKTHNFIGTVTIAR